MNKRLLTLATLALALCTLANGAKKVHTLGDSTMAPYDESATETRGWGMYFGNFLTGGWTSENYAKGGRDSRQGYNELWQTAKNNVGAGDYVLIQFAHNDEKIGGADRDAVYDYYTSKGMTSQAAALETRGTTPSTTYREWLTKIVDAVKAKGATPVLVSAVCRCYFSGGKITRAGRHDLGDKFTVLTANGLVENQHVGADDHSMDYSYQMEQLARQLGVSFIDMTTATKELYESYGQDKCYATLFDKHETANGGNQDLTHFNATGALLAARLCAQLLKEQGILADYINVPTDLSLSPAAIDLGDGYKGQTASRQLTLNGFGLTPADGSISLTASEGIELSADRQNWGSSLTVDYKNGTLVKNFYMRLVLATPGALSGAVTATLGDKTVQVPVTGNVVEAAGDVNLTGSISYSLDKGGTDQGDDAVYAPADLQTGFAAAKWTAGADLTLDGTVTYKGQNEATTKMTKIYNATGASFSSAASSSNTLTLTLTPEDGFTFIPSKVSFQGARFGTDGGTLTVVAETGDQSETLCTNAGVNRSDRSLDIAAFSFDLSSLAATSSAPLRLKFSFIGLGKTKTMGLANLAIEGRLTGSATQTKKYTLSTVVVPAGAGTVTSDPDLASYKEGAVVTLRADRNFGYRFAGWQDADGKTVGDKPELTVTMDAETALKAVFDAVPVYTVTTRATNDADRTLGSVTLSPNDHNGQYEAGSEVTAIAEESKILKFMQWTDEYADAGTSPRRTLTVDGNMELVADYEVQDFIAVFDASANNYYAYPSTSGYPFPADVAWDSQRAASSAVVKLSDGQPAYTKDGGTPVVRNREGVVLSGINGLYQNGYRTTDIAFQFQFSTVGFTTATFVADMAAKNMASKQWKALISTDGKTFQPIAGATWTMTANAVMPLSIDLPAEAMGQPTVVVRITGDGDETLSTSYSFDQQFDGLAYCSHSESGVGNVYVLGTAVVADDKVAPVVTATLPAAGGEGVSASGRITVSYDERITAGDTALKATLTGGGETTVLDPVWNSRSLSFGYVGLAYGTAYTLTIPAGYAADRSGNAAPALTLSFTTMERRQPAPKLYDAIVAQDGSGDFASVQAAVDAAPAGRGKPWLVFIKNGRYKEHVDVPATKPYLHFIGQDRDKTVILDDRLSGGDNAVHVSVGATVVVNADNTFFENLTLENSYGHERQAGPQALALNTQGDRIALNNVALLSYQDTWITSSNQRARHYIRHSLIEGAVDFIYNGGDVYFDADTLEINRPSGGYIVAPWHTAETRWGYVFQNTIIRPHRGVSVKDVWLGRPWHGEPKTVFINTKTYVNLPAKGWYNTMGGLPALWAEYNTVDANGTPLDLSQRETYYYYTDKETGKKYEVDGVKNTLTADEAAQYTLKNVLSGDDGWQPDLMCEPCAAPQPVADGQRLVWPAVPYAVCYVVTRNGEVAGFTTSTSFEGYTAADRWQVQAVNEYGGLSAKATVGATVGISLPTSAAAAGTVVYTIDGRRGASLRSGLNIVRQPDGTFRKVIVK